MKSMQELDPRKRSILRAVILEYVHGAEPVASEALMQKYELGVKSATIRNELAEIAELGFLEKPHTSAGRIPSDKGYRYYVDSIWVDMSPEADTKNQVKEATREGDALQEMVRETTRFLSRYTQLLSVATLARNTQVRVKHAVITALGPGSALMVLVLNNGHVENRLLEIPADATLEHIGQANEVLGNILVEKRLPDLAKARQTAHSSHPTVERMVQAAVAAVRTVGKDLTEGVVIREGEEFLLSQPEFKRDTELFSSLMNSINEYGTLYSAIGESGEKVTIGKENTVEHLRPFTILRASFHVGETEAGTLAIVGPTRLNYDRDISVLDYTARAVSETLTKILKG